MKILIAGIAAMIVATPVFAQPSSAADPVPMTRPTTEPMTGPTTSPTTDTPSASTAAPAEQSASAAILTQKDGKWWKGERRATKAEIAEHQRAQPQ